MWIHQQCRSSHLGASALVALAIVGAPAIAGCSSDSPPSSSAPVGTTASFTPSTSAGGGSPADTSGSAPSPSPTGSWTPAARTAAKGPTAAAAVPTTSTALTRPVALDNRVTVRLTGVRATTVTARTPGETSGPAVQVTVNVQNGSSSPLDVRSAVVSLKADGGALGVGTTAGGPNPLHGTIGPGATATGTYVFMLAPAKDRNVIVNVNYAAGRPVAVFTGRTA